jgi:gas vesicle protein
MEEKEKQEKVYQLTKELDDTKRRKKDVVKAWNNEIKRLQDEIKHIINPVDLEEELP